MWIAKFTSYHLTYGCVSDVKWGIWTRRTIDGTASGSLLSTRGCRLVLACSRSWAPVPVACSRRLCSSRNDRCSVGSQFRAAVKKNKKNPATIPVSLLCEPNDQTAEGGRWQTVWLKPWRQSGRSPRAAALPGGDWSPRLQQFPLINIHMLKDGVMRGSE